MRHKMPDLSTTQLIASGMATLAAAWGASYLGVYGTILGAAFMSVASTAGAAICKHYLDQGKEQLHERTHLQEAAQEEEAARGAAVAATSADPTRTARWLGDANATRFMDDPNATRKDGLPTLGDLAPGDPNMTRIDRTPAETVAAALAAEAGDGAVRRASWKAAFASTLEWAKQRWVVLLVSSAAVFAVVTGGVALYQWQTDKAFGGSGVIQHSSRGGGGGGNDHDETPSHRPSTDSSSPTPDKSGSGSDSPSPGRSSSSPSSTPTTTPTTPTKPPTPTPTPTPDKSTPKDQPSTGGGQGQTPKNDVAPSGN